VKSTVLQGLKALLSPSDAEASVAEASAAAQQRKARLSAGATYASATIQKLKALMDERARVRSLLDEEGERVAELKKKLAALDAERLDALTDARLKPNGSQATDARLKPNGSQGRGAELLAECSKLRQEISDADSVAARLNDRVKQIGWEIDALKVPYRCDVGAFLTALHDQLIERYNELAPGVAEVVLQIAALHRVMMLYQAGNSNGWDGSILLPGMKAGNGDYIAPMLQGSSEAFGREANDRTRGVLDELGAAGFIWRFD
jgi:hypothetical protein